MFRVNLFLLMLNYDKEGSCKYITIGEDNQIPSLEVKSEFQNLEVILDSILTYYVGVPSFSTNFVLHNIKMIDNTINIYYYLFLPMGITTQHGFFSSIENIQDVPIYQKLIQKII